MTIKHWILIAALAAAGAWHLAPTSDTAAQEADLPWATQESYGRQAVTRLVSPVWLELKPVDRFRFAFEMINRTKLGPREPGHAVAWGTGALSDDDGLLEWSLQVDRVNADTVGPFAQPKFATLSLLVDHRGRPYQGEAHFAPLGEQADDRTLTAHVISKRVIDTAGNGPLTLPDLPVGQDDPMVDINPVLDAHLDTLDGAYLAERAAPGRVAGYAQCGGRLCLVVKIDSPFTVARSSDRARLRVTGEVRIDIGTGLPLYSETRITGNIIAAQFTGAVDVLMRTAIALPGMPAPDFDEPKRRAVTAEPQAEPAAVPVVTEQAAPAAPAPQAAQTETAPAAAEDAAGRLRALKQLRDEGLITDQEYRVKRTEILDSL